MPTILGFFLLLKSINIPVYLSHGVTSLIITFIPLSSAFMGQCDLTATTLSHRLISLVSSAEEYFFISPAILIFQIRLPRNSMALREVFPIRGRGGPRRKLIREAKLMSQKHAHLYTLQISLTHFTVFQKSLSLTEKKSHHVSKY